MKRLIHIFLWAVVGMLYASSAQNQERDPLIIFKLASDEATSEMLDLVNAEIYMVLESADRYQMINADELSENMMMSPAESLAFCNNEPGCIADLGEERQAKWILYGEIKQSFDGVKALVHLVLIDVPGKRIAMEKFGQYPLESNVVAESGNLLRELVGIPLPKPKPAPKPPSVAETPPGGKPAVKPPPAPAVSVKAVAPERKSPWSNPWTWTAAGAGVAGIAAGVVLGMMSIARNDQANAKYQDGSSKYDQPTAYGLVQDARSLALGANIAFGVGGAALATAVVLFILDATSEGPIPTATTAAVSCSGAGCALILSARF